jgi:hypothetical protein
LVKYFPQHVPVEYSRYGSSGFCSMITFVFEESSFGREMQSPALNVFLRIFFPTFSPFLNK